MHSPMKESETTRKEDATYRLLQHYYHETDSRICFKRSAVRVWKTSWDFPTAVDREHNIGPTMPEPKDHPDIFFVPN